MANTEWQGLRLTTQLREEDRLTFGSRGAAEGEVQCNPIHMQPTIPAGSQELSKTAVWSAKASQGEGSCGVAPDEAALVIRAQGGLQGGVVPEWE